MASHTRHPPLTRPLPKASRLTESASLSTQPDSRPLYPTVYNPQIPHLHPVLAQGHNLAISSTAAHPTFVDDGEGMSPPSVLHIHTTPYPNEGEKGLEITLEESRMCLDDAAVDDVTQSQSQPKLTPRDGLLSVMNNNGEEVIQRPASAPPIFPDSGLESGQCDAGEAFVYDMDDLREDRVGCVHVILPRASLSRLLAWAPSIFPFAYGRRKHHNPLPLAMVIHIHCWFVLSVPGVPLLWHRYGFGCGGACIWLSGSSLLTY